jgi:hypothetical protein
LPLHFWGIRGLLVCMTFNYTVTDLFKYTHLTISLSYSVLCLAIPQGRSFSARNA